MRKIDDSLLENLSPLSIKEIAKKIKHQIAEPEDALRLMLLFCDLVKKEKEIPKELLNHFHDAFIKITSFELSANRALGVERSNNRPPTNEHEGVLIAHALLQSRLEGNTYESSVALVADWIGAGNTKVKNNWKKYKEKALDTERMNRHITQNTFSTKERKLIDKIYKNESFYVSPFYPNTKAD